MSTPCWEKSATYCLRRSQSLSWLTNIAQQSEPEDITMFTKQAVESNGNPNELSPIPSTVGFILKLLSCALSLS
jgi:hypothetical protein